ncbi:MAG: adenylate/guanylate cyclase domain-containing protein, partial [Paracoccaceae bacterium]
MRDVCDWLANLGLEKYAPSFEAAEVDFETLFDLVEDDLKELGLPLGPRRKIWKAINLYAPDDSSATGPSEPNLTADAERRHLTVMFVDLANSTEMATQFDAEDMRDIITGYQNTVAGIIGRFEGFTAKFMGDGVLCYFGWPRAGEDDAERAVLAGLSIIESIAKTKLPDDRALATRIGVATGVVIVGDLIGSGATQEAAVVGETPNLAARLQGVAGLNQLVIPAETLPLLGSAFELTALGAQDLKGVGKPVEAFLVQGAAENESRFAARQSGAVTPIVGRDREIELISERWGLARENQGQLVIVSGEAGIGKSRITRALIDAVASDDHLRITCQCSPYHVESAFYPVIQQMSFAAGFNTEDTVDQRLDKLEALIGGEPEVMASVSGMLGIDGAHRYGVLHLTPAQQRTKLMKILVGQMVKQAQHKSILVIWEDLHWIDPTSLELMELLLDAITDQPILVLSTARPTFDYGFGGHPSVTRLTLNRLGRDMISAIAAKLTHGKTLPDEITDIIVTRTDGVPLFVEELTKTILESDALKEVGDQLVLDGPLSEVAIPATLHDSLMARLDRLQPIKEVAQNAACIGREFKHGLLAKTSLLPEEDLSAALDGLISAELIYRRGLPPEATYTFKHALVRDAAYSSLLKERRRAIHTNVLSALEADADTAPELLATHAEAAGLTDRAIDLWEASAKAAIARPAFSEGTTHFKHAIGLLHPKLDMDDRAAIKRCLSLQTQLSVAYMSVLGWASDETKSSFLDALSLDDKLGKTPTRFSILYGLSVSRYARGEHNEALRNGQSFVDLAEAAPETAPAVVANRSYAAALWIVGDVDRAQPFFDRAAELFDPKIHLGLANQYGQDLGVGTFGLYSLCYLWRGKTRQAQEVFERCKKYAELTDSIISKCYMHLMGVYFGEYTDDTDLFAYHINAMSDLSNEYGVELFQLWSGMGRGVV